MAVHIENEDASYNNEFFQEKMFGGNFMDKVNWKLHRFLGTCVSGDVNEFDTVTLDISDMFEQFKRCKYPTNVPTWTRHLLKKKRKLDREQSRRERGHSGKGNGGCGAGEEKKHRQFGNNAERSKKIKNPNAKESCMLQPNEQFIDLFHPSNLRNVENSS